MELTAFGLDATTGTVEGPPHVHPPHASTAPPLHLNIRVVDICLRKRTDAPVRILTCPTACWHGQCKKRLTYSRTFSRMAWPFRLGERSSAMVVQG